MKWCVDVECFQIKSQLTICFVKLEVFFWIMPFFMNCAIGHLRYINFLHSCPIHPICKGSPKWWRSLTDRDGSTGSDDSSRIVTDCFDRHTGSHVAKRDSGSELEVVYTYPRKSWRIVTIRDKSLSWHGPRRSKTAREEPSQPWSKHLHKKGAHKHNATHKHPTQITRWMKCALHKYTGDKDVWIFLVLKKAPKNITKHPSDQHK